MESILDFVHQSLLLVGIVAVTGGTNALVPRLCLSDWVVLRGALSTCQGSLTTGAVGVLLKVTIGIVVCAFTSSGGVRSELLVGSAKLSR